MHILLFPLLPLPLTLNIPSLLLLTLLFYLLLLLLILIMHIGLPHSVAAMTLSWRNRENGLSAVFSLKLHEHEFKNCKQFARILTNSLQHSCQSSSSIPNVSRMGFLVLAVHANCRYGWKELGIFLRHKSSRVISLTFLYFKCIIWTKFI